MVIVQVDEDRLNGAGFQYPISIVKRDGRVVSFDPDRIWQALRKCFAGLDRQTETDLFMRLTQRVVNIVSAKTATGETPTVEGVQDIVEMVLQAAGEFEAAKRYIIYRHEHGKERATRPIPDTVRDAFELDAGYFPTPLQRFMYYDKYARFSYDSGRRETYPEAVGRVVAQLHRLTTGYGALGSETFSRITRAMLEMQAMPSMRMLSMAGPAFERDNATQYNCLSGRTEFVTEDSVRALRDVVGQTVNVLTVDGSYRPAEVRSFGVQPLQRIRMKHWTGGKAGSFLFDVEATSNHRWLLLDGEWTTALKVGDKLASPDLATAITFEDVAVRHGFAYGDGTLNRSGNSVTARVRICGKRKQDAMLPYFERFEQSMPPSMNGDVMVYLGEAGRHWKTLPQASNLLTPGYVAGFIKGLATADGSLTTSGNISIATQEDATVEWLKAYAALAGYKILSVTTDDRATNYGERSAPLRRVLLGSGAAAILQVVSIEPMSGEEVFCVVEPETSTFTLANGQVTGNCTYLPIDGISAWCEAMWLSMAGCGVGFSVEERYVDHFPRIARQQHGARRRYVIEDSSEGWCNALRVGCETWFMGEDVAFDYDLIRERGAILRIKGGRASGKEPLVKLLNFARQRILARQGNVLRPIDAHDIACAVGGAAVSGGVRRTAMISIFDRDDLAMLASKAGDFERENAQRWNANNSTVWENVDQVTQEQFIGQFMEMVRNERGEPGIFNREAARELMPARRDKDWLWGSNPCGEIILRPWGMCNLTTVVARAGDTTEMVRQKVETAAIVGTIQSLGTHFPYLRSQWKTNCEEERLLGVSIGGQLDRGFEAGELEYLRRCAVAANDWAATTLGINQSAAITCVKPDGNSSQLLDMSSGIHARWAPYYIRNVRVSASSALARVMLEAGAPMEPENGDDPLNPHTWVISFPIKAPEGAITRNDRTAIDQCDYWLLNKRNWTEHNPSVTITYRPDEVLGLMQWVWDHRKEIGGMAFLPTFDAKYAQLPYVEIDAAEHERRLKDFPEIDFAKVYRYESDDWTTTASEIACVTGLCEIQQ